MSYNSDPLLSKKNGNFNAGDDYDDSSVDATNGQEGCCFIGLINRCKGSNSSKRDQTSHSKRGKRETYNLPDSNKRLIEKLQKQGSNEAIDYINRPYEVKTDQQQLIEAGNDGDNHINEDGIVIRLQQQTERCPPINGYSSPIKVTQSSVKPDNNTTTLNDNNQIPDKVYKQNIDSEHIIKTNLNDNNSKVDNVLSNTAATTTTKQLVNKQEQRQCSNSESTAANLGSNVTGNLTHTQNDFDGNQHVIRRDGNQKVVNGNKESIFLSSGPEEYFESSSNCVNRDFKGTENGTADARIILKDIARESLVNGERESAEVVDYNVLRDISAEESVCVSNKQEDVVSTKKANKNLSIDLNGAGCNNENTSLGGVNICLRTSPEGSERVNDLSGVETKNKKEEATGANITAAGAGGEKSEEMNYYSIVTDPLLYTQADLDEVVKAREDEWQNRQDELETKIKEEIAMRELLEEDHRVKMDSLKKGNNDMKTVVNQYERTIVELTEQSQNAPTIDEDTLSETVRVKDQLNQDLNTAEQNLVDAYKRIEKLKVAIESYKQNEDSLKTTMRDSQQKLLKSEERYNKLKQHASEKIDAANIEIERVRKQKEIDLAGLQAALKKAQNRVSNLEVEISQKTHENRELSQICDELIKKVSGD